MRFWQHDSDQFCRCITGDLRHNRGGAGCRGGRRRPAARRAGRHDFGPRLSSFSEWTIGMTVSKAIVAGRGRSSATPGAAKAHSLAACSADANPLSEHVLLFGKPRTMTIMTTQGGSLSAQGPRDCEEAAGSGARGVRQDSRGAGSRAGRRVIAVSAEPDAGKICSRLMLHLLPLASTQPARVCVAPTE